MGMKSNCGKTSHFKKQDEELREESMLLHIKRVSEGGSASDQDAS